jgi:DNA-binding XRE family transcriptional regulator
MHRGKHRIIVRPGALRAVIKEHADGSRDRLAHLINVDRATTYRIEAGRVDPSTKVIAALICLTGKPFESLFEITQDAA